MLFFLLFNFIFPATSTAIQITVPDIDSELTNIGIDNGDGEFNKEANALLKELYALKISLSSKLLTHFGIWNDWEIGKDLLKKLNELLKLKGQFLKIKSGDSTLFDGKTFDVTLNVRKVAQVPCLILDASDDPNATQYKIGSSNNPPCVTLGHELIHAIHKLESELFSQGEYLEKRLSHPMESVALYRERNTTCDGRFWPLHYSNGGRPKVDWKNLEEQITVIGTPRHFVRDHFSELWLRLACGLYPRFGYHDPNNHFMEEAEYVDIFMEGIIGEGWKERIIAHCSTNNYGITYNFNPSASVSSSNQRRAPVKLEFNF